MLKPSHNVRIASSIMEGRISPFFGSPAVAVTMAGGDGVVATNTSSVTAVVVAAAVVVVAVVVVAAVAVVAVAGGVLAFAVAVLGVAATVAGSSNSANTFAADESIFLVAGRGLRVMGSRGCRRIDSSFHSGNFPKKRQHDTIRYFFVVRTRHNRRTQHNVRGMFMWCQYKTVKCV